MPKMHQNTFGGRAPHGTRWQSFIAHPDPLASRNQGGEGGERKGEAEGRGKGGKEAAPVHITPRSATGPYFSVKTFSFLVGQNY